MITLSVLHINQKMCEIVLSIEDNREEMYAKIIINDTVIFFLKLQSAFWIF